MSDYNSNQLFSESFNNRWPIPEMQHLSTRSERAHSAPETVSELLYRVPIYNSPPVYTIMVTQPITAPIPPVTHPITPHIPIVTQPIIPPPQPETRPSTSSGTTTGPVPGRKRGRPKGSKNQPK